MANACSVCRHPSRNEIDRLLVDRMPALQVAHSFGLSDDAVRRHFRHHLTALLQEREAEETARANDLLAQARDLHTRTLQGLDRAEESGDLRTMMVVVRETRRNLEFLSRLLARIDERPQVNVFASPEWHAVSEVVYAVLEPHPELRYAIAERLSALNPGSVP